MLTSGDVAIVLKGYPAAGQAAEDSLGIAGAKQSPSDHPPTRLVLLRTSYSAAL